MSILPIRLGVNVDHVATLRQARGGNTPDPVHAALVAEQSGGDSITVHLREDRRHIQDRDVRVLAETLTTRMNFECALTGEMLSIALETRPADCCFVPESREELTTEGGLDAVAQLDELKAACARLHDANVRCTLFVDPDFSQVDAAAAAGVDAVELHTGRYADSPTPSGRARELERLRSAAERAARLNLSVHAGHGLNYHNVQPVAGIPQIVELNIGHAIVSRAVIDGIAESVSEMKRLMVEARHA